MRYTRLRRQIESGTLIGTHGTPFPSEKVAEKNAEAGRKRKRVSPGKGFEDDFQGDTPETDEIKRRAKHTSVIKKEGNGSEGFESSGESESEFVDSEDEMPLAKLMKSRTRASAGIPNQMGGHGITMSGAVSGGNLVWD
jgi:hypothetical protein